MPRFPTQQILWRRLDERVEGSIAVFIFGPCSEGEEKPTLGAVILAKLWEMSCECFGLQRCQGTMAGYKCPTLRWCKLQSGTVQTSRPKLWHKASGSGPNNGLLTGEGRRDLFCGLWWKPP